MRSESKLKGIAHSAGNSEFILNRLHNKVVRKISSCMRRLTQTQTSTRTHSPTPSLFLMNIHPPPRRINTFTHPAETDIVNFTPSGKINRMSDRSRHTRRKQTLSTLFQQEVASNTPRLTRSLSADSDISTVHKNPATAILGGNSLTPRGSHGHSRLIQTLQLCNGSIQRTFSLLSAHPADLARATDRFVCCCNVPLG